MQGDRDPVTRSAGRASMGGSLRISEVNNIPHDQPQVRRLEGFRRSRFHTANNNGCFTAGSWRPLRWEAELLSHLSHREKKRKRTPTPTDTVIHLFPQKLFHIYFFFFFIPPPPAAARLPPPTVKPNLFNDNLFPPLPSHEAALSSWCWWGVWVWSASRWVGLCHLVVRLLWDYTLAETEAPTSPNPPFHTHTHCFLTCALPVCHGSKTSQNFLSVHCSQGLNSSLRRERFKRKIGEFAGVFMGKGESWWSGPVGASMVF